jgi:transcriptional regulator GlxA family with amidase domain
MAPVRAAWDKNAVTHRQHPLLLRRLLRAKDAMDASPHETWPIEKLAGVSGVSKAHFARSFKQAFGVPPHRYLLTRRIERAKALLRDTDLPIISIMMETGWQSLGTFGRVFTAITGASPTAFRTAAQASAHGLDHVPHCFISAACRPNLKTAVSEKRRRDVADTTEPEAVTAPEEAP